MIKFINGRILLGLVVISEIFYILIVCHNKLFVAGHDAFQYFCLQYYFLNNKVVANEIPQWLPFMTQGTVSAWWYTIHAGFFQNVCFLISPLLKNVNFYYLFNVGMLVDAMFLILGCWLLAKRYCKSDLAVFFFTFTVVTSTVWHTQPWWNFHLYYCLPLILWLAHRFFEVFIWRYLFLAGSLLALQMLGGLPYFFSIVTFIILLYFLIYYLAFPNQFAGVYKGLRANGQVFLSIIFVAIIFGMVYLVSKYGTDSVLFYNYGRTADGTTDLAGFLSYGENLTLGKWKELLFGISPELDYTLYSGLFVLSLIAWGFLSRSRRFWVMALLIVVLLDFSVGGVSARIAYFVWPLMKYYRHLALISPVIKLFLILLAAISLDLLLEDTRKISRLSSLQKFAPCLTALMVSYLLFLTTSDSFKAQIASIVPAERLDLRVFSHIYFPAIDENLGRTFIFSLLSGVLWFLWCKVSQRNKSSVLVLLIFVHCWDIFSYRFNQTQIRSMVLMPHELSLMRFQQLPRTLEREEAQDWIHNDRAQLIRQLPLFNGVQYWTNNLFLFTDSAGSQFRVENWLRPLDRLMRTFWQQDIEDTDVKPKGLIYYRRLDYPSEFGTMRKVSGIEEGNLQFYRKAIDASDETASHAMRSDKYRANIPFIFAQQSQNIDENLLSHDARMNASFIIGEFSSNRLKLTVDAPENGFLLYDDVWHPSWRATVNGREVTVDRANLAYKMIPLQAGTNHVQFVFYSPVIAAMQYILAFGALLWVTGVIYKLVKEITIPLGIVSNSE